jgi:hypothetical protein
MHYGRLPAPAINMMSFIYEGENPEAGYLPDKPPQNSMDQLTLLFFYFQRKQLVGRWQNYGPLVIFLQALNF